MVVCDSAPINPKEENSSNMNKSSVTTEEREETGFIKEKPTIEEVNNVKEEHDQSPRDKSSSNGSNTSSNVPINHVHSPEAVVEASSLNGVQMEALQYLRMMEEQAEYDNDELEKVNDGDACSLSAENNHSKCPEPQISMPRRELELVALENQILDINDRLETLEFDHDLLEHLTNSLQNGNDGKQIIQDIAHQLYELQRITLR
ncbi:hypothetical protein JHK85_040854 [Glycine max]|nr:hypothetical protein JHK86_040268 [Glycine max]KAG4965879.1 hypothetical protein JHK85_040854 [Glycine max]